MNPLKQNISFSQWIYLWYCLQYGVGERLLHNCWFWNPTETLRSRILKTIKTHTITATLRSRILKTIKTHTVTTCCLECQETSYCVAIDTDSDKVKVNDLVFDCYILGSRKNKPESSNETGINIVEISLFTVSYF